MRFPRRLAAGLLCLLLFPRGVCAQRNLKKVPDPDPELERRSFLVAPGFEVNLYASDPKIAKPIQMNFDPQGRLWIASSEVYPHIKPGQKADDRILIVEDRDGDGKAEKTTVFAHGLLIPTGVEPGDGGAYVANSTELLHFSDSDGDGKADRKRIVLSGFGTEDTHHILHTLRWGPDGCLYMNQSIYIHSHIETPYGVQRLNAGGIWRFRPETLQLGVYARGWYNSWGHQLDDYGQSFATDGAGGEGINFVVTGASYPAAYGTSRILHGLNPGSPKYCGLEIVGGRHLPDDWQGNLLTNDFRGNRVCRFVLSDDGSGFAARQKDDLIKTKHVAFRPVDIKMGPDGAIYIADWYNPIIQHGEVDFRDPRRDHVHGRIWRVTYKGRKLLKRPDLAKANTAQLLAALRSPERWTRHNAKRVLKGRGAKAVLPALPKFLAGIQANDPLAERHRLEALWVCQSLRAPNPKLLESLLEARDPRVRSAAVRVLGHWLESYHTAGVGAFETNAPNASSANDLQRFFESRPLRLLTNAVNDVHPRVRLDAVRSLAQSRSPHAVEIAMQALDKPVDRFLDYALWLTARELQERWLPLLEKGELKFDNNVAHLAFAAKAVGTERAVKPLIELLRRNKLPAAQRSDLLNVVASLGGPKELREVYLAAIRPGRSDSGRTLLFRSLARAVRDRGVKPSGDLASIGRFFDAKSPSLRTAAIECAGLWRVEALRPKIAALAVNPKAPLPLRSAAIAALGRLGGQRSRALLSQLAAGKAGAGRPPIRTAAVLALCDVDLSAAATQAGVLLQSLKPGDDPGSLVNAFLARKGGPAALAKALAGAKLSGDVALLALRTLGASGRKQPALEAAFTRAGNVKARRRALTPKQLAALVAEVERHGDAARGERVFRRKKSLCLKCHSVAGSGGKAGPDLLSIGASAQVDYLIESLLEPNKKVKENYQTLIVVTDAGRSYAGVKVRESDTELVLHDAEDREITIPRKSIELRRNGKSIMPEGLTDQITRGELVDLAAFLARLGKVGKFAVGKERVVRTWRALVDTPEARFRLRRTSYQSAAGDDAAFTWQPAYSTVAGVLPVGDIPPLRVRGDAAPVSFVRFELTVTTPGKVGLKLNDTAGLSLWRGTSPQRLASTVTLDLPKGTHRFTLAVDRSRRKSPLRVELVDVPGSKAVANLVGGK